MCAREYGTKTWTDGLDVAEFICKNQQLVEIIRDIKKVVPNKKFWHSLSEDIKMQTGGSTYEKK